MTDTGREAAEPAAAGVRAYLHRRPMVTAVVYTVIGVLPLYLVSAQAPRLQAELGFGRSAFGVAVASFYLVSSVASRRLGPMIDGLGAGRGLRMGAAVCAVSSIGIGLLAGHWMIVALFLGVAGLGNAFAQLASNVAVADAVRSSRQGLGFGLKQAAVPTGALLAGLAVPLVGLDASWRILFIAAAVLQVAAIWAAPRFEPRRRLGRPRRAPLRGPLLMLAVTGTIAGGVGNSVASFIVDAGVTAGFDQVQAARLLTLGSLMAIGMRILVGWTADRRGRDGRSELVAVLVLGVLGTSVLAAAQSSPGWFVVGVVLAFAGAWGWPGVIYFAVIRATGYPAAAATGSVLAGVYLGTVVLPPIVGVVAEHGSYALIFAILAGLMAIAAVAVIVANRRAAGIEAPAR